MSLSVEATPQIKPLCHCRSVCGEGGYCNIILSLSVEDTPQIKPLCHCRSVCGEGGYCNIILSLSVEDTPQIKPLCHCRSVWGREGATVIQSYWCNLSHVCKIFLVISQLVIFLSFLHCHFSVRWIVSLHFLIHSCYL